MKIKSIDFYTVNLRLTRPYTISYKTVDKVENVIVILKLENGMTGIGTANPSKQVVGDDVQDTLEALQQWDKEQLLNKEINAFYDCLQLVHTAFDQHAGARAVLDIALHDVFTRWLDVPLAHFLGQRIESLPTSITIGIKGVAETLEEAEEYLGRGFRFIKVKLGKSVAEDVERLIKLREKFGDKIHIRVDVNQGYSTNEVLQFYDQMRKLNLELIEQPLGVKDTGKFSLLPLNIRKLIAADESLVNEADALKLAHPVACGIFNVKLMKCGGIQPARGIATIAEAAGIKLMWGCNDESLISIAAALHTAFSCAQTSYLDLDGSLDLARDVAAGAFNIDEGMMSITDQPGLGWVPLQ